jgi:hypothetical protein
MELFLFSNTIQSFWNHSLRWKMMRHGVDVISPSSWETQEEGMMSTVANFPSVSDKGIDNRAR